MSLVAYGSSDDSDSEETQTSLPENRTTTGALFSSLPAPKYPGSTGGSNHGPGKGIKSNVTAKETTSKDDTDPEQYKRGLFSSLPKPKKRTEPVKITVPEIEKRDVSIQGKWRINRLLWSNTSLSSSQSDSDDDEPTRKKAPTQVMRAVMQHYSNYCFYSQFYFKRLLWFAWLLILVINSKNKSNSCQSSRLNDESFARLHYDYKKCLNANVWQKTLTQIAPLINVFSSMQGQVCPPFCHNLKTWHWRKLIDPWFLTHSPSAKTPKEPNLGLLPKVFLARVLLHLLLKQLQNLQPCSWLDK